MREINRAIHIDFHTMPGIKDFAHNFDAAEFAQTLSEANVDYVNFFARCNIGFSYYPTKIGTPYPGMKGDMLGDVITECRKRDIGVSAYLNGGLNHEVLNRHPEWMKVDLQGRVFGDDPVGNNFFRSNCFNTEYRQYLFDEIKEILEKEPDGIFVDCMLVRPCVCPKCIEKMTMLGIDVDDVWQVKKFAYDTVIEVCNEIRSIVPQNVRLYINSLPYDVLKEHVSHAEIECLPTGEWGYDYFPTFAPYFRKLADDRLYMTGKFVGDWGEFGSIKHKASMENDVYDALLYGYKPSVGDHMHPRDGLDKKLYKNIGEIFGLVKELEPYTKGSRAVCDAAIVRNKFVVKNVIDDNIGIKRENALVGTCRLLSELKICHDVVDEDMDFSDYRLIVIPEGVEITDGLKARLDSFDVAVISAGNSLAKGGIWSFIDEVDVKYDNDAFYELNGEIYNCFGGCIRMKSKFSTSDRVEPYFERRWDGKHGYFYIPADSPCGYSAVAEKDGRVHIGFNIFSAYKEKSPLFHKSLFKELTDRLLEDRVLKADELPSASRASVMERDGNRLLHIKVSYPEFKSGIGIVEEHNVLPAGKTVGVKGEYTSIRRLPDGMELDIEYKNGYTYAELPEITGYVLFEFKKKNGEDVL